MVGRLYLPCHSHDLVQYKPIVITLSNGRDRPLKTV